MTAHHSSLARRTGSRGESEFPPGGEWNFRAPMLVSVFIRKLALLWKEMIVSAVAAVSKGQNCQRIAIPLLS